MAKSILRAVLDFRIDVDAEFQGWILLFSTLTAIWICLLPCYCAGLRCAAARRCASWMQRRLWVFLLIACGANTALLVLVLTWLPDWSYGDYLTCAMRLGSFAMKNMVDFAVSIAIIGLAILAVAFKERIAVLLGLDDTTLFRCKLRDCLSCFSGARFQTIELSLLKVEDLPSADLFSANNIFVEMYLGYNEPVRTRVHNNAGSGCSLKQRVQLNFDEDDEDESLIIHVRNQKVMGATELARGELPATELSKMVHGVRTQVQWDQVHYFVDLVPRGKIWVDARVMEEDDFAESLSVDDLTSC